MKHLRSDWDGIQETRWGGEPHSSIEKDEPVFLLRAKDPSAPTVVREWADDVYQRGGDQALVERVLAWADEMDAWRKTNHPDKVVADVPEDALR